MKLQQASEATAATSRKSSRSRSIPKKLDEYEILGHTIKKLVELEERKSELRKLSVKMED
jgi:hypothetical protein